MLFYSFDSDEENPLWPCSPRNLLPHVEPAPGEPSRPPPKGRLSQIAEAVRPGTRPAVPRRTAARARLRGRDAAVRASDSRRRLGGSGTFPPRKSLKTNETELEPRRIPPVRRTPMQRPSRRTERSCDTASVPGVVRWKSARRRIRGCEIFLSATP